MDFELDEIPQALADVTREVLQRELPLERVASDEFQGPGYSQKAWQAMIDQGIVEAFLPHDLGGSGADLTAMAAVVSAGAAHGSMTPAMVVLPLGLVPLARCAGAAHHDVLEQVATGSALMTAAVTEPGGRWMTDTRTCATRSGDRFVLNGVKSFVQYGREARWILVPARTEAGAVEVFCVPTGTPGISFIDHPVASHVPTARVELREVSVPAESILVGGEDPEAVAVLDLVARCGYAASAAGICEAALALTVDHVRTREQFGRPLAQFQAVTMQVADAFITSSALRDVSVAASWQLSTGRESQARKSLAAADYLITHDLVPALLHCQHVHGGTGLDLDYPLHRFLTTGTDLGAMLGGTEARLDAASGLVWAE